MTLTSIQLGQASPESGEHSAPHPPLRPAIARWDRPLRVGVLVGLERGPQAGGHVRCWERLAAAALRFSDVLDLTVHFIGRASQCESLGETVRYVVEPPVFSTERLPFLSHIPDPTDLAPWHSRLARMLAHYDVLHTTDGYFAYARTALGVSRRAGIPLVNSVHTNTPELARILTGQTLERLCGRGLLARALIERLRIPERVEARMLRQLAQHQSHCAFVLVSRPDQLAATRARLPGRVDLLRRGVDRALFNPARRDRAWLAAAHGIPPERLVIIHVGRLNRTKNVPFLVEAVAGLVAMGADVQLVCAGDGNERAATERALGPRVTCVGNVEPGELARLYAASDLFAFPSRIEESANAVFEAMTSALPVLVAAEGGMGRAVVDGETGLVLPSDRPATWRDAIAALAADRDRLRAMGEAARRHADGTVPSWADVLGRDLLPRWRAAAGLAPATEASAAADAAE